MRLRVSLLDEEVEFLDAYAQTHSLSSRSAVVQDAIRALRREELADAYRRAWDEWEGELWEQAAGDGL
jgi:metal-responsive CopG/Arc/MetJ family transcriptional regulator